MVLDIFHQELDRYNRYCKGYDHSKKKQKYLHWGKCQTELVNLGKMLGIRREEIMACGDGDNDIAMLKEVGFGVAMANAEEKVKAVADYITESNNDEGAAKAIEKFVLKRGGESC